MRNSSIILLVLLTVMSVCFSFYLKETRSKSENILEINKSAIEGFNYVSKLYGNIYHYDGQLIKNVLLENVNSKKLKLSDIIEDRNAMILYLPKSSCNSCVDKEIENILEIFNSPNYKERILIISKYTNLRDMKVFISRTGLCNTFNLIDDSIGINLYEDRPVSFVLDSSLKVTCFFIPERSFPIVSKRYYEIIKKRFMNDFRKGWIFRSMLTPENGKKLIVFPHFSTVIPADTDPPCNLS